MARSKRTPSIQRHPSAFVEDPRQIGLRAFQANRFDAAIAVWSQVEGDDPQVRAALAEAHFRRALLGPPSEFTLAEIRRAIALMPDEARYRFHLGRLLHRTGDLGGAIGEYGAALERDHGLAGAAQLLVLATLERDHRAELAGLPGLTPAVEQAIEPALALLRGQQPSAPDDSPVGRFWHGLGLLAAGDASSLSALSDERQLPSAALANLRRYYRGVAAIRAGDPEQALRLWEQVARSKPIPTSLHDNMGALLLERLLGRRSAGDAEGAASLALQYAHLPGSAAFDEQRILALDTGARAAAAGGDWARAVQLWEAARSVLNRSQNLGSSRPLLHNLALAYERLEDWELAADAWRGMLRTRPRRKPAKGKNEAAPEGAEVTDSHWAWVRERIITCYKNAGRPDEAVAVFKQMIKEDPSDVGLRVQLADALLANDQERAASNEIQRALAIDPHHPDALLRQAVFLDTRGQYHQSEQIMRELVERHPERPELRLAAARLFLDHGRRFAQWGRADSAYDLFVEGERYDPENYIFPLNQARMLNSMRRIDEARPLVTRALELAGDDPDALDKIFETWVLADTIGEAHALIEQVERDRSPHAMVYAGFGLAIIRHVTPPPPMPSLFMMFGGAPPPPPRRADTPWTQLAAALFDKASTMRPDDILLHKMMASELMLPRPDMALRYAEVAARLAPDDPDQQALLGLVQGLNDQVREAKATLKRAAQLARKRGDTENARQIQEMSRAVGTPGFRTSVQLSMMGPEALAELGFDEFDDSDDDF